MLSNDALKIYNRLFVFSKLEIDMMNKSGSGIMLIYLIYCHSQGYCYIDERGY